MFISSDLPFLSVPVRQITANPVTTGASSKSHLHAGAIAGGTIGVAASLAIGAALLARNRSRRRKPSFVKPDSSMTVTPFNLTLLHASTPSDSPAPSSRVASPPLPPPSAYPVRSLRGARTAHVPNPLTRCHLCLWPPTPKGVSPHRLRRL